MDVLAVDVPRLPQVEAPLRQPSLLALLRTLWRRRVLIGLSVLVGVAAAAAVVMLLLKPRYDAEVLLLWSPPWLETQVATSTGQIAPPGVLDTNVVRGVVAILSSDQMARRVVSDMRLHTLPEFSRPASNFNNAKMPEEVEQARIQFAATFYRRGLRIVNDGRSYAISITVQSTNRELSAAIANRHAELYLEAEREAKNQTLINAREWLDREVQRLSDRLRAAEAALRDARDRFQPPSQRPALAVGGEPPEAVVRGLEREVSAARGVYEALLARQREVAARESVPSMDARLISAAVPPLRPSGPNLPLLMVLAAMSAFTLGAGLALCLEWLRPRFHEARDLEQATSLSVLATMPAAPGGMSLAEAELAHSDSTVAEAVRSLRAALILSPLLMRRPSVLAVVSLEPTKRRTSMALALARSLARVEERVLLIETDLRQTDARGEARGTQAVLNGDAALSDVLVSDMQPGLKLLVSSGTGGTAAREQLGSPAMARLLQAAQKDFDWIILDTPPFGVVHDALLVARHAHGTLLVIGADTTPRAGVQASLKALGDVGIPVLGAVLESSRPEPPISGGVAQHAGR